MDERIHPTAIVDARAEIDTSVRVGAYAVIGADVQIGAGCTVAAHAVLEGPTTIGAGNRFYSFSAIGGQPQDKKYAGEATRLEIGNHNTFREYVTVNRGTAQDVGVTRIGDDNWIMAYVHIAHDCQVGSHTIFANTVNLAGHVSIGDWAILGGYTGVHQFCKIGAHVMTGVGTVVLQDIPPYVMAAGNVAAPHGINSEGLKRRGFSPEEISVVRRAYKTLYRSNLGLEEARQALALAAGSDETSGRCLTLLLDFLGTAKRGIIR
ncbi:MAG: acyl-ACP--UDP-N-acetylglucosamine O-acyltransferase [Lautropia sp.]